MYCISIGVDYTVVREGERGILCDDDRLSAVDFNEYANKMTTKQNAVLLYYRKQVYTTQLIN